MSVRAGLIAYATGCVAMGAAALIDGFILPALAVHYANGASDNLHVFQGSSQLLYLALVAVARLGVLAYRWLWPFGGSN